MTRKATGTGTDFEWTACTSETCTRKHIDLAGVRSHRQAVKVATPRLIKVKVVLSVTVDVDDYTANYGTESIDTIRRDVRQCVNDAVNSGAVLADGIVASDLVNR